MKFEKKHGTYYSADGEFRITESNQRIKGLNPKYVITKKSGLGLKRASTLAEAKEICKGWI